ncbi:MAG: class I SAM-dependent methyltransferase [Actinomycetota bacterium]|nr:class I SAM-dependent methyltransferase [Actinomycetota bacterium]
MSKAPHSLFARIYDLFMVPQDRFGLRHQRERLCSSARGQVLEVAVGTGLNIPYYRDATSVVGIDLDRAMLRRAVRRTWETRIPVELVTADARALPFPSGSFDTVVVALSLCTISDPAGTLEELRRVSIPGAHLHFLEHVRSAKPLYAKVQDRIAPAWESIAGGCRANQDTAEIIQDSNWSMEALWTSNGGGFIQGTASNR